MGIESNSALVSRLGTSLHHSTLAEQPSPDSSPSTSTSFPIPRNNKGSDSPIANNHNHHSSSHASSLGSASTMDYAPSGDDSDSSSDEDLDVELDPELSTPFAPTTYSIESAASISLLNHQKARLGGRGGRSLRHSSMSSASVSNSLLASPSATTPPIQSKNGGVGVGYFGRSKGETSRRKDSLTTILRNSLGTGLRGGRVSEDEKDRPDPIRRPVSRRGSLLVRPTRFLCSIKRLKRFGMSIAQDQNVPAYQGCLTRGSITRRHRGQA